MGNTCIPVADSRFPLLPLLASLVTWLTIAGGEAEKVSTQQRPRTHFSPTLLPRTSLLPVESCLFVSLSLSLRVVSRAEDPSLTSFEEARKTPRAPGRAGRSVLGF